MTAPHDVWKTAPEEHDYPAAAAYLSLLLEASKIEPLIAALRTAPTVPQKAKDLLRASGLPLLPKDNLHVAKDLHKVNQGTLLSPLLLVRGDLAQGVALTIADGYHRMCASYYVDEDLDVQCRIVGLEPRAGRSAGA